MPTLTDPQIQQFLVEHPNRQVDGTMLVTTYDFEGFLEAVDFVTDVAQVAEQLQHHPDILIQYNTVTISTTTHDAGDQITDRDIELLENIEKLLD